MGSLVDNSARLNSELKKQHLTKWQVDEMTSHLNKGAKEKFVFWTKKNVKFEKKVIEAKKKHLKEGVANASGHT